MEDGTLLRKASTLIKAVQNNKLYSLFKPLQEHNSEALRRQLKHFAAMLFIYNLLMKLQVHTVENGV